MKSEVVKEEGGIVKEEVKGPTDDDYDDEGSAPPTKLVLLQVSFRPCFCLGLLSVGLSFHSHPLHIISVI